MHAVPLLLASLLPVPGQPQDVRLVVVVAVDQMIPEQLDRLESFFTGGLARFVGEGAVFPDALLGHGVTETGPGHVTLATGMHPNVHGVVANGWMGRDGEDVYCLEDLDVALVDDDGLRELGDGNGRSPRNSRVPALGDVLRELAPGSRTVAVGGKDRAAIGLAGRAPAACLWWNKRSGGFMSSAWYGPELPVWLREWNASWRGVLEEAGLADGWRLELAPELARAGTVFGDRPDEASRHAVNRLAQTAPARYAYATPGVDHAVFAVARRALDELALGLEEAPDVLLLGLSACDVVGHSHGPYSDEVTDTVLRIDRELGRLFDTLDERLGEGRWIAALAADHGVLPLPSEARRRGHPSRVVPTLSVAATLSRLRTTLAAELGGDFVAAAGGEGIRLAVERLEAAGHDPAEVRSRAAEIAREAVWIERAHTAEELEDGRESEDPWLRALALSFDRERSPDVVFVRPPWTLLGMPRGTSHGTPFVYDRKIALAFVGAGVPAGRFHVPAGSADVVPTLLAWMGLLDREAAEARFDGRVLLER